MTNQRRIRTALSLIFAPLSAITLISTSRADEELLPLAPVEVLAKPAEEVDSTALKLPASLHETPRSMTVIDADRILGQDFQTLDSTFRYVPGVFNNAVNNDSYHFFSRGFDTGPDQTLLDGFTGMLVNGSFSPSLFGIEQVVYLRGPASLLYGAATVPSGVINLITKKPQATPFARLGVRYATYDGSGVDFGSHGSYEATVDLNQLVDSSGLVRYRFTAEADNRGFYNDGILDRERAALFALTWKFGPEERFSLTPVLEYERQPFAAGRGLVISPSTSLSTADGQSGPIHLNDLTPVRNNLSGGYRLLSNQIAGLDFAGRLTPAWSAYFSYRFIEADSYSNQFTPQAATLQQLDPANPRSWVIQRRQSVSETDRQNNAFDFHTQYEVSWSDGIKNLTQVGLNGRFYSTSAARSAATQPNQSSVNIYTGVAATPLVDSHPILVDTFLNDDFYWNTYLQNQTSFADRWIVTLGAGYGEQRYGRLYPAGQQPPANLAQLTATRQGNVTPNAAVVFNATRELSIYASYSTSYLPADSSYENAAGKAGGFSPTTGLNYETGAKFDLPHADTSVTVSLFETVLDNVLVESDATDLDPNGNRYYTQTGGGRRTRGTELSAAFRPLRGWNVDLTGSFLDSIYRGEGRIPGSATEKTPRWAFSLYNRYEFTARPLQGLSANLGLIWQDARLSAARTPAAPDPLVLPAYMRIDSGLAYHFNRHWDVAVNCENLANQIYFVTGSTGAALEAGAPRTLSFRAGYQF